MCPATTRPEICGIGVLFRSQNPVRKLLAMNIAIVHYHLNRGGVTRVVANHLAALDRAGGGEAGMQVAVLYGGRPPGWPEQDLAQFGFPVTLRVLPELDYDEGYPRPEELERQLVATLQQLGFSPDQTVVHCHNHALGKNASLPGALIGLARHGYALLLQIHDFAEDFRPENYQRLTASLADGDAARLPAILYPQAPQIHYAVLNGRDQAILDQAGIDGSRLRLLPNPVSSLTSLPDRETARAKLQEILGVSPATRYVLYPVRGIRRKNLGEALLWSALADDATCFGLTLAPLNPVERPSYDGWKALASELQLPFLFEVGEGGALSYAENLVAADLILTSSVAEGFGMVFLESWLHDRPLIGRDLPEITADFFSAGLQFDGMRPRIEVPVEWVGKESFRESIGQAFSQVRDAYGCSRLTPDELRSLADELAADGQVDFAVLTRALQRQVVRQIREDHGRRGALHELNPWMDEVLYRDVVHTVDLVTRNAACVRQQYSLERCGTDLLGVYRAVAASERCEEISPPAAPAHILDSFLSISRLHPIRIEK